jgi:2-polyprenyl-3-methyl-5-hydroxy-6-metoxy-1,4-benzoquinol methylase
MHGTDNPSTTATQDDGPGLDTDVLPEAERSRRFWDAQARDRRYKAIDGPGMLLFDDRLVALRRGREEAVVTRILGDVLHKPSLRVLDAGCGTGRWSFWFAQQGARVTAIDFSREMIDRCCERQQKLRNSGESETADLITFVRQNVWEVIVDGEFDVVFCGGVLQYLDDRHVSEFGRCAGHGLKPNGVLLTRDSVLPDRIDQDGDYPVHYRRATEYESVFQACGLKKIRDERAWIHPQVITKLPLFVSPPGRSLALAVDVDGWLLTHAPIKWLLPLYRRMTGRGIGAVPEQRFFLYQRRPQDA